MAIVANTYQTFDSKGNREELSNIIYNISPEDVLFTSMASKGNTKAVLTEWQTETLDAAVTTNAQLRGDDVTSFDAVTPTVRVGNYTQIARKTFLIEGTQEAIDKAGRSSEIAHQTQKKGKELKRDMEANFLSNRAGVAGNSTTAPNLASIGAWVKANDDFGAGGASPVYTSGVPGAARTDGTLRAFTETILKSVIESVWTSGGSMKFLFVGPVNKQKVSAFDGIATRNYDLSNVKPKPTAIIAAADVYVSDFGTLSVLPSRFQREQDGWLFDFEFLEIPHLRPFRRTKLAKTGDAEKFMLLVEYTLKVKQEAALGLCADLTTT